MKRFACPAAVLALSMVFGCNSGTDTNIAQSNSDSTKLDSKTQVQPVVIDGVGTEPAQAVAVFLDSLRRGDENAANGVLTSLARDQVQKTNYQIQPPGTPDGKYAIGRVGFPYPEKTVALVECQWTEPSVAGETADVMDIVCEVHQEVEGWRIAGLGFKIAGTDETLVLDFENAASLQETLESANRTPAPQAQTAQSQTQPFGSGEAASGGALALPPPQLAFPPLNNSPVLR